MNVPHNPTDSVIVDDVRIRRCACGFILIATSAGNIWWIKAKTSPVRIESFEQLVAAISTSCRLHGRQVPPPQVATVATGEAPQSKPLPKKPTPRPAPPPAPEPPQPSLHVEPELPPTLRKLQMRGRPTVIVKRKAKAK